MPTSDERREVAARLRELHLGGGSKDLIELTLSDAIGAWRESGMSWDFITERLADLIEPEERTCHMIRDHLTDTAFCDVCGERFDGVAQYMAMVPNGFSVADYKAKYKDAKFCPNCGAKVVRDA